MNNIIKINNWDKWDFFVKEIPNASFLALSTWLDTYCVIPYLIRKTGFYFLKDGEKVGGVSGIKIGFWKLSIAVFPSNFYFLSKIDEKEKEIFLDMFMKMKELKIPKYIQFVSEYKLNNAEQGKVLRYIYLNSGIGKIDLDVNIDLQLSNFKMNTRRNIRSSLKHGMTFENIIDLEDLKSVYKLLKLNAKISGYKIRPFWVYKKAWLKAIENNVAFFYLVKYQNELKGCIWLYSCGGVFHNIMSGSVKDKPRMDIGYFIQWNVILKSFENSYPYYNISTGGNDTVKKFKEDFGSVENNLNKYYFIKN